MHNDVFVQVYQTEWPLGECCLCTQAIKGVRLKPDYTRALGHKAPLADDQNSLVVPTLETPAFIEKQKKTKHSQITE